MRSLIRERVCLEKDKLKFTELICSESWREGGHGLRRTLKSIRVNLWLFSLSVVIFFIHQYSDLRESEWDVWICRWFKFGPNFIDQSQVVFRPSTRCELGWVVLFSDSLVHKGKSETDYKLQRKGRVQLLASSGKKEITSDLFWSLHTGALADYFHGGLDLGSTSADSSGRRIWLHG